VRSPQEESESVWIERLGALADTPERQAIALQWTLSKGEGDQLAEVLDAFETNSLPAEFSRIDAPRVTTSRDTWFGGAVGDELQRDPERAELQPLIEHLAQLDIDTSSLASVDDSRQQAGWWRFVPGWSAWATRQLTERDWRQSPAAFDFLALQTRAELPPDERPRFDRLLVDLLRQQQREIDATAMADRLLRNFPNTPANAPGEAQQTIAQSLANSSSATPPDGRVANVPQTFSELPLAARQTSVNYAPPREILTLAGAPPALAGMRFEIDSQERRLMMFETASGRLPWNPPLRGPREQQSVGGTVGRWLGPMLFLAHQGVLHAVSPLEKTIRWSHDLGRLPTETMMTADGEPDFQTSHPSIARRFSSLRQQALRDWPIVAVTPTAIVLHSDRRLTVLDPWTGAERWRFDPLPVDVLPLHLGGTLFFVSEFGLGDVSSAHRLEDGRPLNLDTPAVKKQLEIAQETLALIDDRAISWKGGTGLNLFGVRIGRATLAAADARTGRENWAHDFPAESRVAILDSERILVVEPSGKTAVVNVASGSVTQFAPYPVRLTRGATVHALSDAEFDYLIVDRDDLARTHHYAESLDSLPANGLVAAWKRSTGELAWSRTINGQYLLVSGFESSPVLVFLSRGWQQREKLNFSTLKVDVWRKADGKPLYSKSMPSMYSGFHTCDVHADAGTIDLIAYNLRLRLSPDPNADPAPVSALAPANSSAP
jgi:outer membrane protein assembly factor BamB